MSALAFFDVDHTLIDGNSGFQSSLYLIKKGILKKRRLLQALYYYGVSKIFFKDVKRVYFTAIKDIVGEPVARLLPLGKECFDQLVKPLLFKGMLERIEKHRSQNDKIILLTSGPYMTLNHLADYLKVDGAHMMGPKTKDGIILNELLDPICNAEGKVHYAKLEAQKYKVDLKDCTFYSDHYTDEPLLSEVGHPYCVNPDWRLKKIAERESWPILEFSETLG